MSEAVKRPKWFRITGRRKQWDVTAWHSNSQPLKTWEGTMCCITTADMSSLQAELLGVTPLRVVDNLGRKGTIYARAWMPTARVGRRAIQYEIRFVGASALL